MSVDPQPDTSVAVVVAGCHVLGASDPGDPVWGHVSFRDPDGRGFWVKAGAMGFDEVTSDDVILVDDAGERVVGHHRVPLEHPIHGEILRARPDVASVVHAHPPNAIALAASGQRLHAFSNAAGPFAAGVPIYGRPVGLIDSPELGVELAQALGDARAVFLVGHGIVTVGPSVPIAVATAVLLERACHLQLLVSSAGGLLPELAEPGDRYAHTEADGYVMRTWEYLLRRVSGEREGRGGAGPSGPRA